VRRYQLSAKRSLEKMKEVAKEGILLKFGELTMKHCERVPAECKEKLGEDERDGERADTFFVW
jgi:hypothetical protein